MGSRRLIEKRIKRENRMPVSRRKFLAAGIGVAMAPILAKLCGFPQKSQPAATMTVWGDCPATPVTDIQALMRTATIDPGYDHCTVLTEWEISRTGHMTLIRRSYDQGKSWYPKTANAI